jgi:hypothetical protein
MSARDLPFVVVQCVQNSPEWYATRAGKLTGSRADVPTAKPKSGTGEAITRRDYRIQMALERIVGRSLEDRYLSRDMLWGKENEPLARYAYEAHTGNLVEEVGFLHLPSLPVGCSLDGVVEDRGLRGFIEIKCPKSATHWEYLQLSGAPDEYRFQLIHNFWVTGFDFCDFVTFDPRYPKPLRLAVRRVMRNADAINTHIGHAMQFLAEVTTTEALIRRKAA